MGCELLVLLEACGIVRLSVFCCVSGDAMSPVASLSSVGLKVMFGRLRLWLYIFCGWRFGHVVCGPLGVLRVLVRFVNGG